MRLVIWALAFVFAVSIGPSLANFAVFQSKGNPQCLNLVAVGDSITVGQGTSNPYPENIGTVLASTASNQGHGGAGWNYGNGGVLGGSGSLINLAAAGVDPLLASLTCGNGAQPYLVLFAGTNDIFYGATPAATYSSFQTYFNARISAGWNRNNILVATILQRAGDSTADRGTFNASLVSGVALQGYTIVRLDLDANIGCDSCNTNLTYFQSDQVHPNDTGLQIVANLICLKINPKNSACPVY